MFDGSMFQWKTNPSVCQTRKSIAYHAHSQPKHKFKVRVSFYSNILYFSTFLACEAVLYKNITNKPSFQQPVQFVWMPSRKEPIYLRCLVFTFSTMIALNHGSRPSYMGFNFWLNSMKSIDSLYCKNSKILQNINP